MGGFRNGDGFMMLAFSKMEGAGNDFVVADDSAHEWPVTAFFIRRLCDRRRGVGADGLILLAKEAAPGTVAMRYFNSDGSSAAVCGNGLRCAAVFVCRNGLADGCVLNLRCGGRSYRAEILNGDATAVRTELAVSEPFRAYQLETGETVHKGAVGVPHAVAVRPDTETVDVERDGRFLRYHPAFRPAGANADFVSFASPEQAAPVAIRTYERGVEAETLACGTGCAAAGIVLHRFFAFPPKISFLCRGNDCLNVEIWKVGGILKGVQLTGPAKTVFTGEISCGPDDGVNLCNSR